MTQSVGTTYLSTIATLSDDASIVEAFQYYHTGGTTGSTFPNSIEQRLIDVNNKTDTTRSSVGYFGVSPTPPSVHARLNSLETTVGLSLSATYIKSIPSSNDTPATRNLISSSTNAVIPLSIQGVIGQTADLQQWRTSAAIVAKVTSQGAVHSFDGSSMAEVATLSGTQTFTNKTLNSPISTIGTNARVASYTLVLSDQSKVIEVNSSVATTITVPRDSVAYPIGTYIVILQVGSGQVSIIGQIVPNPGGIIGEVTINSTPGNKTRTQWSMATLIKRSENEWVLAGDLVS